MEASITNWLKGFRDIPAPEKIAERVVTFIRTPEFAKLYAKQMRPQPDKGVEITLTINGVKDMSALTDAMQAALANLQTKLGQAAPTADQITAAVHAVVDPAVATLNSQIAAITASENNDAGNIADITAAVTEFTTALAPASTPAPTDGTPVAQAMNTAAQSAGAVATGTASSASGSASGSSKA